MKLNLKKILIAAALVCGAGLAVVPVNQTSAKASFVMLRFEDLKGLNEEGIRAKLKSEGLDFEGNDELVKFLLEKYGKL